MNYTKIRQIRKLYFGCRDISGALNITAESAKVAATRLVQQGQLLRLKRNVYILKDRWDALGREEKFMLANLLQTPSYISLMTAMDYYEITTQVQRDFIESIALYRTKEVNIEKNVFYYRKINKGLYFGFLKERGFFIATPEKAFLDALYFTSLKKYSFDIGSIDFGKLKMPTIRRMLKQYPQKTQKLCKTYGYFKQT
jgi:predicted transcriptional regulator of viral defense system